MNIFTEVFSIQSQTHISFDEFFSKLNNFHIVAVKEYDDLIDFILYNIDKQPKNKDSQEELDYICYALIMFHSRISKMLSVSTKFSLSYFIGELKQKLSLSFCEKELLNEIFSIYTEKLSNKNNQNDNSDNDEYYEDDDIEIIGDIDYCQDILDKSTIFNLYDNEPYQLMSNQKISKKANQKTKSKNSSTKNSTTLSVLPTQTKSENKKEQDKNQKPKKKIPSAINTVNNSINSNYISLFEKTYNNSIKSPSEKEENKKTQTDLILANNSINNPFSKASSGIEDKIKKIDDLLLKIQSAETLGAYIISSIKSQNCSLSLHNQIYSLNLKNLPKEYLLKALTLLTYFFPLLTEKQKQVNITKIKQESPLSLDCLETNLLYINTENEKNKNFINELIETTLQFNSLDIQNINTNIHKIKTFNDIKDLFIFFLMYKGLSLENYQQTENSAELTINNISYIIIYLITQYTEDFSLKINQFLYDLYLIKAVYSRYLLKYDPNLRFDSIFDSLLFGQMKLKQKKDIKYQEYLELIFDKKEIDNFNLTKSRMAFFYNMNNLPYCEELKGNNLNFVLRNNELEYMKKNIIFRDISRYKSNLIGLEEELFFNARKLLNDCSFENLESLEIPKDIKKVFNCLDNELHLQFPNYTFCLYPFGSITQFLNLDNSDLDVYLEVDCEPTKKIKFINNLAYYIKDYIDKNYQNVNSARICLLSFNYNGVKIDMSCIGICPYLHSNILRSYSQIDARFPILAINIKKLIKKLGLDNKENNKSYLNSFCWMMLLITFLQDVISPPVLPKLLVNAKKTELDVEMAGKKRVDHQSFFKKKTIRMVMETVTKYKVEISEDNFNNKYYIYRSSILQINQMSLSELFLKFLEFVIFYFKNDSLFVNFSYSFEGIMSLSKIKNLIQDKGLREFYYNKYLQRPKGDILFREPYDSNYNPGQTLTQYNDYINKLKEAYFQILQYGSLNQIGTNFEEFEGNFSGFD